MKTLKDFTPEIRAKIPQYLKRYTEGIYNGERWKNFKQEDAEALINWNYEKCGYKKPVVIVAGNPYEAQLMFNFIKATDKFHLPILTAIYGLKNNITPPAGEAGKLYSQLGSQLGSQLDSQLRSQLVKYNDMYLWTSNIWSNAYLAWLKFAFDEFNLDNTVKVDLDSWNDLYLKGGVYSAIFSELVCVVSKYPNHIHVDGEYRLHSTKGVAVEWEAYSPETDLVHYYIHGRNIPKAVVEVALKGDLTKEIFVKEANDEYRSAWYNYLGEERMLEILGAVAVDTFNVTHNNKEYELITLFKTREKLNKVKDRPYAWLKRVCPSTGNVYLTPTDPDFKSAEQSAKFHRPDFVPTSIGYHWFSRS